MPDPRDRLPAPLRRHAQIASTCLLVDAHGGDRTLGAARAHVVLGGRLYLVTECSFSVRRPLGGRVRLAFGGSRITDVVVNGVLRPVVDTAVIEAVHRAAARRHPLVFELGVDELGAVIRRSGNVWRFVPSEVPVTLSA